MNELRIFEQEVPVTDKNRAFCTRLGKKIRQARNERNISADDLATADEITTEQLSDYKNAKYEIPIYTFLAIMEYMDYPAEFNKI